MSGQRPPTFGDVSNSFGEVSQVEDYEPPATSTWRPPADEEVGLDDDEPFTVADLSASRDGTVPAAFVPTSTKSPKSPFRESVPAPNEVSGRIGPAPPPPQQPVRSQAPISDTATLLGSAGQQTSSAPLPGAPEDPRSFPFYNIKRYRTYFNVDTSDVLHRIFRALALFFRGDFLEHTHDNPDLYGPFWIASTLVFVSAAAGNYASYIAWNQSHSGDEATASGWYYDVDKVGGSMALFYGYVGLAGLALWGALKWFQSGVELAQVWCAYGYSMVVYIPMAIVCIVPAEILRWAVVGAATAVSGLFLLVNFRGPALEAGGAKGGPLLLAMLGVHAVLGLVLKVYFFHYA